MTVREGTPRLRTKGLPAANRAVGAVGDTQHNPVALICQFHQLEAEPIAWAAETGGSVVEFHLYALDGPLATAPDNEVWNHIRPTVLEVIPERATTHVVGFTIGTYENFSSFVDRDGKGSPVLRFVRSGRHREPLPVWRLDPLAAASALRKRSVMTGRRAANACRFADGVREVASDHVTPVGPLL